MNNAPVLQMARPELRMRGPALRMVRPAATEFRRTACRSTRCAAPQASPRPALRRVMACSVRRTSPEVAFYRKYTEAMLRRCFRMSMEAGRVPSMLGREMFRSKVTSCKVHSFEDAVIFVHDVENCVKRLDELGQKLLERIAVQEYTQSEVSAMLGMSERTVVRRYEEALDELTTLFLGRGLLEPMNAADVSRG